MKDYREEEAAFFEVLQKDLFSKGIRKLAKDGIVNPNSWEEAKIKCLFLLKEPVRGKDSTEKEDHVFSLTSFLRNGAAGRKEDKTWKNVARWIYSIFTTESHLPYKTKVKPVGDTAESRKEYLKYVAVVNLKKQPGGATTQTKELKMQFEKYYAKWLPQQLRIYDNADAIICCGKGVVDCLMMKCIFSETFDEPYDEANWRWYEYPGAYKAKIRYYRLKKGLVIIDFWHPSARIAGEKKNNVFKNLIKELILSK